LPPDVLKYVGRVCPGEDSIVASNYLSPRRNQYAEEVDTLNCTHSAKASSFCKSRRDTARLALRRGSPFSRFAEVQGLARLAVPAPKRYFVGMSRRLVRRMVYALVAVQLLLSAPLASALAEEAVAGLASPCAGMDAQPANTDSDSHPCCSDPSMDALGCLSACTAGMAVVPGLSYVLGASVAVPAEARALILHVLPADPPLNPPPIA